MYETSAGAGHHTRIGERLAAVHRQRFCGREEELAAFRAALLNETGPFSVLYVHGLGGVGKSAFLREYSTVAQQQGVTTVHLDGRLVDPSPGGFLLALTDSLGLSLAQSPLGRIAELDRFLVHQFPARRGRGLPGGGHRYVVYAHDWRVETFDAWWQREAERSIAPDGGC